MEEPRRDHDPRSIVAGKYTKCQDFTESVPADSVPGSGSLETTTQSVSNTTSTMLKLINRVKNLH